MKTKHYGTVMTAGAAIMLAGFVVAVFGTWMGVMAMEDEG